MLTRIISAVVALPVVLWAMVDGGWSFGILVVVVGIVCMAEFLGLVLGRDRVMQVGLTGLGLFWMASIMTGVVAGRGGVIAVGLIPVVILGVFLVRPGEMESVAARAALSLLGLWWAGGLLAVTASLRGLPNGMAWVLLAFVLAWGSDTGAYFSGRLFGAHRLYPKVSPNKTWEGALGGVIVATAGAFGCRALLGPQVALLDLAWLAPVASILGQAGDLAESMLKRSVGVKDSGSIMPGHGGLFDRVDSLLFVGPVLMAYALAVRNETVLWLGLPW